MTKVTLRKAGAMQAAIQAAMNGIQINADITVTPYEDAVAKINKANADVMAADARRSDLLMALYSLRSQVGEANVRSGISSKLTHAAFIDRRLQQLESLSADAHLMTSLEVIQGRLERIKSRSEESASYMGYRNNDEITTGVITTDQQGVIRTVVRELRKQRQTINDEILELNVKTEIELTPEAEAVLVREGIM